MKHPSLSQAFRRRGGSKSERRAASRDGLEVEREFSVARRGESDMASAVQKIKLSPSRDILHYPLSRVSDRAAA